GAGGDDVEPSVGVDVGERRSGELLAGSDDRRREKAARAVAAANSERWSDERVDEVRDPVAVDVAVVESGAAGAVGEQVRGDRRAGAVAAKPRDVAGVEIRGGDVREPVAVEVGDAERGGRPPGRELRGRPESAARAAEEHDDVVHGDDEIGAAVEIEIS